MKQILTKQLLVLALSVLLCGNALARDNFKICWSIYVGWMPWAYGDERGWSKNERTSTTLAVQGGRVLEH